MGDPATLIHTTGAWGFNPTSVLVFLGSSAGGGWITSTYLKWRKANTTDKESDRQGYGDLIERMRKDISDMKEIKTEMRVEMAAMRAELTATTEKCSTMRVQIGQVTFAMEYLIDEVQKVAPEHPGLQQAVRQARHLLALAFPGGDQVPSDIRRIVDELR